MKLKRKKSAKRTLQILTNNFGYSNPYKILIDGTFAKSALDNKVQILDQIKNYFGSDVKLYSTECVINEVKEMGKPLYGVYCILRNYDIYECECKGMKMARGCLKQIIESNNPNKLIFATKDPKVTNYANTKPGMAIVYMNGNTIILENPSQASVEQLTEISADKAELTESEKLVLKKIQDSTQNTKPNKKRKKPKQPNPLSCKKSKKLKLSEIGKEDKTETTQKKKKRKKVRVAAHAVDAVRDQISKLTA